MQAAPSADRRNGELFHGDRVPSSRTRTRRSGLAADETKVEVNRKHPVEQRRPRDTVSNGNLSLDGSHVIRCRPCQATFARPDAIERDQPFGIQLRCLHRARPGTLHFPAPAGGRGASFYQPSIVVDTRPGPRGGTVYLVAAQTVRSSTGCAPLTAPVLASSTDGGRTLSAPVCLEATKRLGNLLSPVVVSDGSVGFGFVDFAVDARAAGGGVTELKTPRI